jgi:chloramphenicol O-acetyltransferase type B
MADLKSVVKGILKIENKKKIVENVSVMEELIHSQKLIVGVKTYGLNDKTCIFHNPDERIEIGSFCSIAGDVRIFGGGEHDYKRPTTFPIQYFFSNRCKDYNYDAFSKGKTIIGNDVWLGHGSLIMSGVKIGDGSVIGAKCVVTQNIDPYSIVVGNPCRVIKKRFSDDIINKMLTIAWWNWSEEKIKHNLDYLAGDIEKFIEMHYDKKN